MSTHSVVSRIVRHVRHGCLGGGRKRGVNCEHGLLRSVVARVIYTKKKLGDRLEKGELKDGRNSKRICCQCH